MGKGRQNNNQDKKSTVPSETSSEKKEETWWRKNMKLFGVEAPILLIIGMIIGILLAFFFIFTFPDLFLRPFVATTVRATVSAQLTDTVVYSNPLSATDLQNTLTFTPDVIITPTITVPIEMLEVLNGEFAMGSSYWVDKTYNFAPSHMVYLKTFYIDKYEVTNAQYQACVVSEKCARPDYVRSNTRDHYFDNPDFNNYPVIYVSWQDAKTFCVWRKARLPTEAEWEKVAKWNAIQNSGTLFPWGENNPNPNKSNFDSEDTVAVGSYSNDVSSLGAYDMAGNVSEWVYDNYMDTYYRSSPGTNPSGPTSSSFGRVIRGGAWNSTDDYQLWTISRLYLNPDKHFNYVGFRCASDKMP